MTGEVSGHDYPAHLALAFIFLGGYLVRTLCLCLRIPAGMGVLLLGVGFQQFMQEDFLAARDVLTSFSFFLVLLKAGLVMKIRGLSFHVLLCSWLPVMMELVGLATYAAVVFDFTLLEALVTGTALCAVGEGMVIPKVNELGRAFPDHPMPRLLFSSVPLEAAFALPIFGMLRAFAMHEGGSRGPVFSGSVLRLSLTIVGGGLVGSLSGLLMHRRTRLTVVGRKVFTGQAAETFLLFISIALAFYGLALDNKAGSSMLPMGFIPGPLVVPELLLLVLGTTFAAAVKPEELQNVELILGGLWLFGALILLMMVGTRFTANTFDSMGSVLPLMLTGFVCRFAGILISLTLTHRQRVCSPGCEACRIANRRSFWPDALFAFVCILPRTTMQGALATIPMRSKFFAMEANGFEARNFIADAGKIYIVVLAFAGTFLMDFLGPKLLKLSVKKACRHQEGRDKFKEDYDAGWTPRLQNTLSRHGSTCEETARLDPLNAFEAYIDFNSFVPEEIRESAPPAEDVPPCKELSRGMSIDLLASRNDERAEPQRGWRRTSEGWVRSDDPEA